MVIVDFLFFWRKVDIWVQVAIHSKAEKIQMGKGGGGLMMGSERMGSVKGEACMGWVGEDLLSVE